MSDELDDLPPAEPARPRTLTVLGLLVGSAAIISYLAAYALTNALVAADFLSRWQPGHDPRPRRMLIGFTALLAVFGSIAGLVRWTSRRQLRSIDEMEHEEPRPD